MNDPWGNQNENWSGKPQKPPTNPYDSPFSEGQRQPHYQYQQPHRGGTVMGLGIASLVVFASAFMCCVPFTFLSAPLGFVAWFMGRADLHKINSGRMNAAGRDQLMVGSILGLVFAVLSTLICLAQLAFLGFFIYVSVANGEFRLD